MRLLATLLVFLLLAPYMVTHIAYAQTKGDKPKVPNPISILYNATNVTRPNTGPLQELTSKLIPGINMTNTSCKKPSHWLSWDTFKYIGCKVKEGAESLVAKFAKLPVIGGIVEFFKLFGAFMLQMVFNIGWLFYNIGAAFITALSTFVEIIVWLVAVVTTYVGDVIPWIPWIVLVFFFATFVESANRTARERSLFPLLGFVTFWFDFFERIYKLFEKIIGIIVQVLKTIIELIKP